MNKTGTPKQLLTMHSNANRKILDATHTREATLDLATTLATSKVDKGPIFNSLPMSSDETLQHQTLFGNRSTNRLLQMQVAAKEDTPWEAVSKVGGSPSVIQSAKEKPLNTKAAENAHKAWRRASAKSVSHTHKMMATNWGKFLAETSKSPSVSMSYIDLYGLTSNAFGNAGSALIAKGADLITARTASATLKRIVEQEMGVAVEAAGAAIGTMILPGPGTLIGFGVGVLVETILGNVFDSIATKLGYGTEDNAYVEGSLTAGKMINEKWKEYSDMAQDAHQKQMDNSDNLLKLIFLCKTQEQLDLLTDRLQKDTEKVSSPDPNDMTFYKGLLREWVLQHAGDEEDENKDTSPAQWAAAQDKIFKGKDLDNRPDLFLYQTKLHWAESGIGGDEKIKKITDWLNQHPLYNADQVEKYYHAKKYNFIANGVQNTDRLFKFINRYVEPIKATGLIVSLKDYPQNKFTCTFDLTTSDGSCYVDSWDYEFLLSSEKSFASFSVSPD